MLLFFVRRKENVLKLNERSTYCICHLGLKCKMPKWRIPIVSKLSPSWILLESIRFISLHIAVAVGRDAPLWVLLWWCELKKCRRRTAQCTTVYCSVFTTAGASESIASLQFHVCDNDHATMCCCSFSFRWAVITTTNSWSWRGHGRGVVRQSYESPNVYSFRRRDDREGDGCVFESPLADIVKYR